MRRAFNKRNPEPKLSPMTENILSLADNTPGYGREKLLEELKVTVEDTELYTASEVAKMLKVTSRTVRRWQERGWLVPSLYIRGSIARFTKEDIRKASRHNRLSAGIICHGDDERQQRKEGRKP